MGSQIFVPACFETKSKRRQKVPLDIFSISNTLRVSQLKNLFQTLPHFAHVFVQYPSNSSQISFKLSSDAAKTSPTFHSTCRSFTGASLVLCNGHPAIHPADISSDAAAEKQNLLWNPRQTERKEEIFPVEAGGRETPGHRMEKSQAPFDSCQRGLWFLSSKKNCSAFLCRNASAVSHGSLVFLCSTLK